MEMEDGNERGNGKENGNGKMGVETQAIDIWFGCIYSVWDFLSSITITNDERKGREKVAVFNNWRDPKSR